ncbi:hypothetical protein Salat_0670700 [Sesamum alatum]|uniref:Uncharacterized protein n=1 Tax=Sesamum alatum TaxID=300844 RepID=A0AAE1YRA6_9LAMI|nr:hypothetical protein Salat_0670700 [Sesamum alatum]
MTSTNFLRSLTHTDNNHENPSDDGGSLNNQVTDEVGNEEMTVDEVKGIREEDEMEKVLTSFNIVEFMNLASRVLDIENVDSLDVLNTLKLIWEAMYGVGTH